jgi:hypothetical protein
MRKTKNKQVKGNNVKIDVQELVNQNKFSEAIPILYENQQRDWPLLKAGVDALCEVKTNKYLFDGYQIQTQYNPRRINSTTADVSTEAVKNRKCFLCTENLPEKQEGINYQDKYSILFNPYPIFHEHLTVASFEHKSQRIMDSFPDMLQLNRDISDFTFIYNGPESGASAPDHLHFQACRNIMLPINKDYDALKNKYGEELVNNSVSVWGVNDGIRKFISVESASLHHLIKSFRGIYNLYSHVSKSRIEPMLNILSSYDEKTGWKVIIFFRKKHRPDAYFEEGDSNILVSPASIDLGGVLITPLEKDFEKVNKEVITQIFREVAMGKESFEYLKTKLKEL